MQAEYDYMMQAIEVNKQLMEACDTHPKLSFRTLRGLKANWKFHLVDGVHLTWAAMKTFFNDVRSALIVEKGRLYA